MSDIRPLWDHRGGILARAFYFISNYVLEYDISTGRIASESKVIIIDRWYASTLAYTVAYHDENEQIEHLRMEDLPNGIFQWPSDLNLCPHLMLILDIDPETRQARVEARKLEGGGASRYNPWDDRLADDQELGNRIIVAMKKIQGPLLHTVNANGTKKEVLDDALEVLRGQYKLAKHPKLYYENDPLMWWRHDGVRLGLCNEQGKRCHHALWNLQLAFGTMNHHPPVLKTVGLNHIDSNCIYYWDSSSRLDNEHSNNGISASVLWCAGAYPLEHQWRAEGFVTKVTKNECSLFGFDPPHSLLIHIAACEESAMSSNDMNHSRMGRNDSYDEIVQSYLSGDKKYASSTISLWRFNPVRIEVLRGGPSTRISPYPERLEWIHKDTKWCMRSILPFTPPTSKINEINVSWKVKNCTIALLGTHTAGKTTIGNRLSELIGWHFDEELGKILRDEDELVANGHLHGDGKGNTEDSSSCKDEWDDLILQKECERDLASSQGGCRIVETWHGGNAAWNYFRRKNVLTQKDFRSTVLQQYLDAMAKHVESTSVLMILLSIDSNNTIINRRLKDQRATQRLPLQDEREDASDLLCLNDQDFYEYMSKATSIPLLIVDNTEHGEEAIQSTLKLILNFILENAFRRVDIKENVTQNK